MSKCLFSILEILLGISLYVSTSYRGCVVASQKGAQTTWNRNCHNCHYVDFHDHPSQHGCCSNVHIKIGITIGTKDI